MSDNVHKTIDDLPLRELFLSAPESQIDPVLFKSIEKWSNPPSAVQILHTLDHAIYGSLATGWVVSTLQDFLTKRLDTEGLTYEQVEETANKMWRTQMKEGTSLL